MSLFETMAPREKLLLLVLGLALVLGGYFFTRGADLNTQVLILDEQLQSAKNKLSREQKRGKKVVLPELNGKQIKSKDIKKLDQQVEEEKALLSGFGHVFVDLRDKTKVAQLVGDVNRNAKESNLQLLSKVQSQANLIQFVSTKTKKASASSLNRPLYDLHLQGGYSALHGFIQRLSKLEYSVVPIKIQISRTDRTALGGGHVLDIQITLAL